MFLPCISPISALFELIPQEPHGVPGGSALSRNAGQRGGFNTPFFDNLFCNIRRNSLNTSLWVLAVNSQYLSNVSFSSAVSLNVTVSVCFTVVIALNMQYNSGMKAYQFKLLPTNSQSCRMQRWLDMVKCQYNWLLADRFDWYEMNRCPINACPLVCSIAEARPQPEYYGQKRSLVALKTERECYKDIHADVLQDMVKRVDLAFVRFIKGDSNGKRSGKPRIKCKNRYRTFAYQRVKPDCIPGNRIELPKLGEIKFIQHRPVPDGFAIKKVGLGVRLTRKRESGNPRRISPRCTRDRKRWEYVTNLKKNEVIH